MRSVERRRSSPCLQNKCEGFCGFAKVLPAQKNAGKMHAIEGRWEACGAVCVGWEGGRKCSACAKARRGSMLQAFCCMRSSCQARYRHIAYACLFVFASVCWCCPVKNMVSMRRKVVIVDRRSAPRQPCFIC